ASRCARLAGVTSRTHYTKEEESMKNTAFSLLNGGLFTSASGQRASGLLKLTISLFAFLMFSTPTRIVLSQTATTSRISGTVSDPNKAVLPGVEVELSDPSTNQRCT